MIATTIPTIQFKRFLFEEKALEYPLGRDIYSRVQQWPVEVKILKGGRISGIPGRTPAEAYREGKRTLVVGLRKKLEFETCKPSAHYQLPLVSSCIGKCEYCYLQTQLGNKPYVKVNVNIAEIMAKTRELIKAREPEVTLFEASATSDPIPVERISGILGMAIGFFGSLDNGRLRLVTKFADVEPLVNLQHHQRTTIRFSVNPSRLIQRFEHGTTPLEARLTAARRMLEAGYPIGLMIAPVFIEPGWQEEYRGLLDTIRQYLDEVAFDLEIITHRFTTQAKGRILELYPESSLPMVESERRFKYGQFGYGKYVYPQETMAEVKNFFNGYLPQVLPGSRLLYLV